jgi:hypothetical protein
VDTRRDWKSNPFRVGRPGALERAIRPRQVDSDRAKDKRKVAILLPNKGVPVATLEAAIAAA